MASATELDNLIIRLTGDGSSYQKMMQTATTMTQQVAGSVMQAGQQIENISNSLNSFASKAVGALGMLGVVGSLRGAFDAFAQVERNQIQLRAAIESGGHSADEVIAKYERLAASLTSTTLATKGQVMSLAKQAEMFGLSGDQAERAIRNALALASATGRNAEGLIRGTIAMEQGNLQMIKRQLHLNGVKDETQLLTRVNGLLVAGQKASVAEFNSASGQIERLGRSLKGMSVELGAMIAKFVLPVVAGIQDVVNWFKQLPPEMRRVTNLVLGLSLAFLALPTAMGYLQGILGFVLSPLTLVMGALVIATAIWVETLGGLEKAWIEIKDVISFLFGVIGDFIRQNEQLFIWLGLATGAIIAMVAAVKILWFGLTLLQGILALLGIWQVLTIGWWIASTVAVGIYSGSLIAFKAIIWLVNVALAATNVLLAVFAVAAAVLIAVGLVAFFTVLSGVVVGIAAALGSVVTFLGQIPVASGPIAAVANLFSQWFSIIKDIVKALEVDMPLAWRLIQAAGSLAINQLKDLFPPLWEFIKEGFGALWDTVSKTFSVKVQNAFIEVAKKLSSFNLIQIPGLNKFLEEMQDANGKSLTDQIAEAEKKLKNAVEKFKVTVGPETIEAQKEVDKIRAELAKLLANPRTKEAQAAGQAVGAAFGKGLKDSKLDGVLFDSAEALARITAYKNALNPAQPGQPGGSGPIGANLPSFNPGVLTPNQPAVPADPVRDKIVQLIIEGNGFLKEIRDKPVVQIEQINL